MKDTKGENVLKFVEMLTGIKKEEISVCKVIDEEGKELVDSKKVDYHVYNKLKNGQDLLIGFVRGS